MNNHSNLEKLKADRELCLQHFRRDGILVGWVSFVFAILHVAFHTDPEMTILLAVCLWLAVAPWGVGYLILSWHVRRMTHD
jgi:hypothetical protein